MFTKALFALALLGCPFFAFASTYNLDLVNPQTVHYGAPNVNFNDTFTFTIASGDVAAAAAIKLDISFGNLSVWGISNFLATSNSPALTFSATLDNANATIGYHSGLLTAGSYSFDVTGTTTGLNGGTYTAGFTNLSANASAVPVPGAIWLFGSALFGFASLNRRKQATA